MNARILAVLTLATFGAGPLAAGTAEELSRLLRIDDVMVVMREEGLKYGGDLQAELFPDAGRADWQAVVDRIYDPEAMARQFDKAFSLDMVDDLQALDESLGFFGSDRGQRIVALEIAAREALLDPAVEEAAQERVQQMRRADDPRLDVITRYADVNDLIEQNVAGALNANLAFYRGMIAGGAFDGALSEGDVLADVWSREGEIRQEMQDWLFPFLTLAYEPLPDIDLEAYVAFSETPSGQTLNAALFAGFDAVFEVISEDLGHAAAQMMSTRDL